MRCSQTTQIRETSQPLFWRTSRSCGLLDAVLLMISRGKVEEVFSIPKFGFLSICSGTISISFLMELGSVWSARAG